MGALSEPGQYVGDSELCVPTPAFSRHTEILRVLGRYFRDVSRCAFVKLPVGKNVGGHIDQGSYYLTRDRYHISIQGKYKYIVGDEYVVITPGMLVWFNNKVTHGTENLGDVPRITFVFDVKNPSYEIEVRDDEI
jgi:mannose-6-phosphate isomerase-like protein (cupin superfamily)